MIPMSKKRIHITGVGGQGTLIATALIGQAALLAGVGANLSEIHGMAQRGGIVESAVTLGDLKDPMVSKGEADILLGFEPAETLRAASRCNSKTVVITNTTPLPPFTVSMGQEEYPDVAPALQKLAGRVVKLVRLDADSLARKAGNILALNIVMLGALARHGDLPLTREQFLEAIKKNTKAKFLDMNLKAFEMGYAA
jgi:indolepyruvate ferredoxin oxidoreductase, beta subunit